MIRTLILVAAFVAATGSCSPARPPVGAATNVAAGGVSNPTVALERDGAPLVAWVGQDGNVFVARRTAQGTFGTPVRANDIAGEAAPHEQAPAQVAVGRDGHAYVMWQTRIPMAGRRFPASDLRFARSIDGGRTFEPAKTINDDAAGPKTSHTFHDLYVDRDGTVFASWIDGRSTEGKRSHHKGGHGGHAKAPGEPLGPEIRVARSTDGGQTFSASVVVDRDACPCCRTSLARAPDGTLFVAWRKIYSGDVRDVVVARSTDGGATFGEAVRVHNDGWVYPGCPHAGPSIAVDSAGVLHVVWYTGAEGRAGLHLAASRDGGKTFGAPQALTKGIAPVSHARLAPTSDGVWIAWEDRNQPGGRVALSRCGPDGVLRFATELKGEGRSPAIAAVGGAPAVAWLAGDTVRVALAFAQ
jgi:hypothetical protein